ncbi:hypothetical protein F4808DRAFT_461899 [Astrocystis sublimbata]|nr:hypothetical protein F4808DRAFT_461899 [Astrocystis sublimbata]
MANPTTSKEKRSATPDGDTNPSVRTTVITDPAVTLGIAGPATKFHKGGWPLSKASFLFDRDIIYRDAWDQDFIGLEFWALDIHNGTYCRGHLTEAVDYFRDDMLRLIKQYEDAQAEDELFDSRLDENNDPFNASSYREELEYECKDIWDRFEIELDYIKTHNGTGNKTETETKKETTTTDTPTRPQPQGQGLSTTLLLGLVVGCFVGVIGSFVGLMAVARGLAHVEL